MMKYDKNEEMVENICWTTKLCQQILESAESDTALWLHSFRFKGLQLTTCKQLLGNVLVLVPDCCRAPVFAVLELVGHLVCLHERSCYLPGQYDRFSKLNTGMSYLWLSSIYICL